VLVDDNIKEQSQVVLQQWVQCFISYMQALHAQRILHMLRRNISYKKAVVMQSQVMLHQQHAEMTAVCVNNTTQKVGYKHTLSSHHRGCSPPEQKWSSGGLGGPGVGRGLC